jgi:hypothetical protein
VNCFACVWEKDQMGDGDGWCTIFAQTIEICEVSIRVLNNRTLW